MQPVKALRHDLREFRLRLELFPQPARTGCMDKQSIAGRVPEAALFSSYSGDASTFPGRLMHIYHVGSARLLQDIASAFNLISGSVGNQ